MDKIEKLLKKLPTGWAEEANGMTPSGLKAAILQSEVNIKATTIAKEADEKLQGAKEIVKDLNGPYADAVKAQRAKIAYALYLLEEKGLAPGAEEE